MKKLLALGTLLLLFCCVSIPCYAQDSPRTVSQYITKIWETAEIGINQTAKIEVPSWAKGMVLSLDVTACTGCAADLNIRMYYPGTDIPFNIMSDKPSANGINTAAWRCIVIVPRTVDLTGCSEVQMVLPTGTVQVLLHVTAGTIASVAWVRWIPEAS